MSRTIVVGDVHGCLAELEDLLRTVSFGRGDRLVFVGDLVAKGPDSKGVVQLARERSARAVRGNHDEHVLKIRRGEIPNPKPTHASVAESLDEDDWRYLEELPFWHRLDAEHLVVHGGFVPGLPLEQQEPRFLMNLRSVLPMNVPSTKIEGEPWAAHWKGPERVLFGHDAVRGLQRHPHAIGLDSGCVYGRELSAWIVEEGRLAQVKARQVWSEPKP